MTVGELIKELEKLPQDLNVMTAGKRAENFIIKEYEGRKYVRIFVPQQKIGKWIDLNGDKSLFECSECGDKVCCANNNYCPNCGVKMEVEKWEN